MPHLLSTVGRSSSSRVQSDPSVPENQRFSAESTHPRARNATRNEAPQRRRVAARWCAAGHQPRTATPAPTTPATRLTRRAPHTTPGAGQSCDARWSAGHGRRGDAAFSDRPAYPRSKLIGRASARKPQLSPRSSAVILTRNEADRLERCVPLAALLRRILVIDAGSTGGTANFAQRLGARVINALAPLP